MDQNYIRAFRGVLRRLEREIFFQSNESCCSGVTLAQCHALLEVEQQESISVSDLAKCLSLDKSTVSRTVEGLNNIGLLQRTIPSENRRMAIVNLTDLGKTVCDEINKNRDVYYSKALEEFDPTEKDLLLKLLKKLTGKMSHVHQDVSIKKCEN